MFLKMCNVFLFVRFFKKGININIDIEWVIIEYWAQKNKTGPKFGKRIISGTQSSKIFCT